MDRLETRCAQWSKWKEKFRSSLVSSISKRTRRTRIIGGVDWIKAQNETVWLKADRSRGPNHRRLRIDSDVGLTALNYKCRVV